MGSTDSEKKFTSQKNSHLYSMIKQAAKAFCTLIIAGLFSCLQAESQSVKLKIHLDGVYASKISVLPMSGIKALKPIIEVPAIQNGGSTTIEFPQDQLPGQFVLRFDYQEKETSNPYPSEKFIFVNKQNLELWVNPRAMQKSDSTYLQKGEIENSLYEQFMKENAKKREQIGLLQNFLLSYDQPHSQFYQMGIKEFESRRNEYNQWINSQSGKYKETFVGKTFQFQKLQAIDWKGNEQDRLNSLIAHFFDDADFKDPLLLKTAELKDWMNKYVNLYGSMSTTVALRDSLFTLAGNRAIEKAKLGDPIVYGWMVDYFYQGYEAFNITKGLKMLEPYMNDPLCMTSKRQAIESRIKGIETLVAGAVAPDFAWKLSSGKMIQFHDFKTEAKYKLVLFWSADCQHCREVLEKLYPWYDMPAHRELIDVFAISLDETPTEIPLWEKAVLKYPAFKHKRAEQGVRSPEASAYFVLSTPTMVLVDAKTNKIVALPNNADDMEKAIAQ
jgi:peroxiredoxin